MNSQAPIAPSAHRAQSRTVQLPRVGTPVLIRAANTTSCSTERASLDLHVRSPRSESFSAYLRLSRCNRAVCRRNQPDDYAENRQGGRSLSVNRPREETQLRQKTDIGILRDRLYSNVHDGRLFPPQLCHRPPLVAVYFYGAAPSSAGSSVHFFAYFLWVDRDPYVVLPSWIHRTNTYFFRACAGSQSASNFRARLR